MTAWRLLGFLPVEDENKILFQDPNKLSNDHDPVWDKFEISSEKYCISEVAACLVHTWKVPISNSYF
jgi:hypothetical protein